MLEQINVYYKPLNKFNIQGKYYNVYLNKNNNLNISFLNNVEPISKISISLNDISNNITLSKDAYNNLVKSLYFFKKINNNFNNLIDKYIEDMKGIQKDFNNFCNSQEKIINLKEKI